MVEIALVSADDVKMAQNCLGCSSGRMEIALSYLDWKEKFALLPDLYLLAVVRVELMLLVVCVLKLLRIHWQLLPPHVFYFPLLLVFVCVLVVFLVDASGLLDCFANQA